jgi:hypothetical protein
MRRYSLFLAFASRRHLEHPAYAEYIKKQKLKKQKQGEKNKFNSHLLTCRVGLLVIVLVLYANQ